MRRLAKALFYFLTLVLTGVFSYGAVWVNVWLMFPALTCLYASALAADLVE